MKKMKRFALTTLTALLTAILFIAAVPVTVSAAEAATITVSGAGAVTAAPDMATIHLGVNTEAETAVEALARNNADIEAVLTALRELGIEDEDIRTQWFSIHQRLDWGRDWNEPPRVIGYNASNTVVVTVHDLDLVGEVLGAGVAAGANAAHGVQFSVSNAEELYLEALAIAAQNAQRKATVLARALGSAVTGIVSVHESSSFFAPVAREAWSDDMPMPMAADAAAGMEVPVQPGELTVTARVQVVFTMQ